MRHEHLQAKLTDTERALSAEQNARIEEHTSLSCFTQGLLFFWLFKGTFKVSSGTDGICSYGTTDFENSETANPVSFP